MALATVVATRRSAPRPVGSKLIVSENGDLFGSVSGGCVESDVAVQAAEVLASGEPRLLTYGITDDQAWEVGLPCGGEIDVFIQALAELPADGEGVLVTRLEGDRAGQTEIVSNGDVRSSGIVELEGERVFAEVLGPPPSLVVVGATDTAEALCRLAGALGWRTVAVDPRAALATEERLPSAWPTPPKRTCPTSSVASS